MLRKPGPDSRIIAIEQATVLLAQGWSAADLHVHTYHSNDVIPTRRVDPLILYRTARSMGMTFVAFTDHDTMDAYDQIGWTRDGLVPAVEIKILDRRNVGHTIHANVYLLDRKQFREIHKIAGTARDIELLIGYLNCERLPFIFNHPFWHEIGEKPNLKAVIGLAEMFPVLEYNMGRIARINAQALRLVQALGKGIVAATDTHIGDIGRAFTLARGTTFREFFDQIRRGGGFIVPADLTLSRLKEETAFRIRHLFDKSGWLFSKKSYGLETGISFLDGIIGRLGQTQRTGLSPADRILQSVLNGVSRTGIPGFLYLRSQRHLADRIGPLLENAEPVA